MFIQMLIKGILNCLGTNAKNKKNLVGHSPAPRLLQTPLGEFRVWDIPICIVERRKNNNHWLTGRRLIQATIWARLYKLYTANQGFRSSRHAR